MDIQHRLRLVRSWARWIIAGTVIAAVAAYAVSGLLPKVYEADARLVVGQALSSNNPDPNQFQTAQQLSAAYVALAYDRPVLEAAMKGAGLDMPLVQFADMVSVEAVRELPFIDIIGRSGDPALSVAIANSMAEQLVSLSPTLNGSQSDLTRFVEEDMRALETQIDDARTEVDRLLALPTRTDAENTRLEALVTRLVTLRATYAQMLTFTTNNQSNRIAIVQDAIEPTGPASPRPLFNVAIAASLALLLGIGAAFLWERLDDRIKTPEDLESVSGLAMLGLVAQMPGDKGRKSFYRLATLLYPRSPAAEAFRTIRTNIEFAGLDRGLRMIVVSSALPREGKTVVASNLAVAFAQAGRRTILVDADLRRPAIAEMFGQPDGMGLTDVVRTDSISIEAITRRTEVPGLSIISAGTIPANPAELLGSKRMEAIIERLKASADIVIFDTPPVTAVTDAALLAAKADATIMVVQSHRASERVVAQGMEALTKVNAHVIGAVLNNVPGHVATPYYGRHHTEGDLAAGSQPVDIAGESRFTPDRPQATKALDEPAKAAAADDEDEPVARETRSRRRTPTAPPSTTDFADGPNA